MRRVALLVVTGLFAQRWSLFGRWRRRSDLQRANAELREALDSERRRADDMAEELTRSREQFDRTLGRVNDLFWTVEILPDREVKLVYVSADASGVVGVDVREGFVAIAFRAGLRHPGDAAEEDPFTEAMLAGRPAEVEERLVGYDGVARWTWSRGTPRREGDRLFFDGVTTNITERHELTERREALLKREREQVAMLEEMQQSRDDFIALAGHELRTPLTVIQGYAEQLLDDPVMGPEQRTQLEIVVRRATSMSDLIDDLFDLSKLDTPLSTIAFAPVPLDELVEESVVAHGPMARERDITFEVTAPDSPVAVTGDRARLSRMLDNVIGNAVKYSPAEAHVSIDVDLEDGDAVIQVADQGIGIPDDELPRVFERLYRASNAVDLRYPGTGLGLSIVLATALGHGGTAAAEKNPAGGTVVTIRLPVQDSTRSRTRG